MWMVYPCAVPDEKVSIFYLASPFYACVEALSTLLFFQSLIFGDSKAEDQAPDALKIVSMPSVIKSSLHF